MASQSTAYENSSTLVETLCELQDQVVRLLEVAGVTPQTERLAGARTARALRMLQKFRTDRQTLFPGSLFGEPAWDMLLELYASHLEEKPVSITALAFAAGIPPTTGVRWVEKFETDGLIIRTADPKDRRRYHLVLSDVALAAMSAVAAQFAALANALQLPEDHPTIGRLPDRDERPPLSSRRTGPKPAKHVPSIATQIRAGQRCNQL